jgi:hypothetical protein
VAALLQGLTQPHVLQEAQKTLESDPGFQSTGITNKTGEN